MRCPKCGAFMDEGRDVCFMCGTNVKTYNPNMQMNGYDNQPTNSFSNITNYDNIYNSVKSKDHDIFDFVADHKGLVSFLGFVFTLAIVAVAGLIYYKVKNKTVELEPVVGKLYYEIDDEFKDVSDGDGKQYSLSQDKGASCNIAINYSADATSNHVDTIFESIKETIEPERDSKLEVLNKLEIYTTQEGSITINGDKWYYLNVYYPEKEGGAATILKYRFLARVVDGYSYDIELRNNNNEDSCAARLDNMARSLQFVETSDSSK